MTHERDRDEPSDRASRPESASGSGGGLRVAALAAGVAALAASAAVGCADSSIGGSLGGPTLTAEMQLDFSVPGATSSSARSGPSVGRSVTISDSDLTFTVDSVDFALRELQVGKEGVECSFGPQGSGAGGTDGRECEEFSLGTFVFSMPVSAGTDSLTTIRVEPAAWDHVDFQFNVLEVGQPEDTQVIGNNPHVRDASVFIQYTLGGTSDTLLLGLDGRRTVDAPDPVTLEEDQAGRATLSTDVATWFDDGNGGVMNPDSVRTESSLRDQLGANIDDSFSLTTGPR